MDPDFPNHDFQPIDGSKGGICWAWVYSSDPVPIKMRCSKTWSEHREAKLEELLMKVISYLEESEELKAKQLAYDLRQEASLYIRQGTSS